MNNLKVPNSKAFLAFLLLLAPACGVFKRKPKIAPIPESVVIEDAPLYQEQPQSQEYNPTELTNFDYVSQDEQQSYNQDLDAFVLSEEDDKFNNESTYDNVENITLVADNNLHLAPAGQENVLHADSTAHGLKNVYYDFGKSGIKDDQQASLEHDYAIIQDLTDKGYTIVCEGHACTSAGSSDARNITISEERPQHVADYFVSRGVNPEKIKVVGRGAELRIVPSGDRVEQAPNRRVEFYAYPPKANLNA